jgi:hypothetical protein
LVAWIVRSDAAGLGDQVQRAGSGRSHQYSFFANASQAQAHLARIVEEGPIPGIHGVVRWRACDLSLCRTTIYPAQGIQAEWRGHGCVQENLARRVAQTRAKLAPAITVAVAPYFRPTYPSFRRIKTTTNERIGPLRSAKRLMQESGNHESPSTRAKRKIETANSVATRDFSHAVVRPAKLRCMDPVIGQDSPRHCAARSRRGSVRRKTTKIRTRRPTKRLAPASRWRLRLAPILVRPDGRIALVA